MRIIKMRIICSELTTKISTPNSQSHRTTTNRVPHPEQTGVPKLRALRRLGWKAKVGIPQRSAVTQVTPLPDLHRIGYTQNLPIRQ
jgi:hypothetical protein